MNSIYSVITMSFYFSLSLLFSQFIFVFFLLLLLFLLVICIHKLIPYSHISFSKAYIMYKTLQFTICSRILYLMM